MTNPDPNNLSGESCPPHQGEDSSDLAALREKKGLSLSDVFAKTRISTKNLAALERNDFAALPPGIYTKAFIRQYAELLGIDPQPILLRYATYVKSLEDPQPIRKKEEREASTQTRISVKKLAVGLTFLAIVISLALFIYSRNQSQPEQISNGNAPRNVEVQALPSDATSPASATSSMGPDVSTPVPATGESAAPSTASSPGPESSVLPPPQADNMPAITETGSQKLTIIARETSWIGIRIDQQAGQQVLLHPADTVTYTGNLFHLDIGNAGGVDVFLADKPLPPFGDRGQVVHVTLP